jgi:hypothetical protein
LEITPKRAKEEKIVTAIAGVFSSKLASAIPTYSSFKVAEWE